MNGLLELKMMYIIGRTWSDFKEFLQILDEYLPEKKYVFVHNLSFEFQFLKGEFNFKNVFARKAHKVIKAEFEDFNIELRCSYFLSNVALKELPKIFDLKVEKLVGDLDYDLLRTSETKLSEQELKYCENDVLVVYFYIKRELETYNTIKNLPLTSTGHVRKELKEQIKDDKNYRKQAVPAINTNPHIFNLLQDAFQGRIYTRKFYICK